jgi:hypothetical protein
MNNAYILSFDLPRELDSQRKRINRELRAINAQMIQHSFWKSRNLKELISIALFIKNSGGIATILEEKLIF